MSSQSANSYWKANLKIVASLLIVWFVVSFGAGILFVDALDTIRFAGFKFGFWRCACSVDFDSGQMMF